jgi:hypothetical protein
MSDKVNTPKQSKERSRKPYARPVLQKYGSIRVITQDIGSMGNADGGAAPKTKSRTV